MLTAAFFEVMDKEPSLLVRAILFGLLGIIGYFLSRRTWWWGLVPLPVVAVFAWIDLNDLLDPFVGPAITREAGRLHVVGWYAVMVAGFALPIAGALSKKAASKSRRHTTGILV
jgi:hypothetical protein